MDHVTCLRLLTSLAILMTAYGAGVLFFYGVPFGRRDGEPVLAEAGADRDQGFAARWWNRASWAGLLVALLGAAVQAWTVWLG
jgi:hypothetical protein